MTYEEHEKFLNDCKNKFNEFFSENFQNMTCKVTDVYTVSIFEGFPKTGVVVADFMYKDLENTLYAEIEKSEEGLLVEFISDLDTFRLIHTDCKRKFFMEDFSEEELIKYMEKRQEERLKMINNSTFFDC